MPISPENLTFIKALDAFTAALDGQCGKALRLGDDEVVFLERDQIYSATISDTGEVDIGNAGCISAAVWAECTTSAQLCAASVNSPVFVREILKKTS